MDIEHLISTMFQNDTAFLSEMHLGTNSLVVNQSYTDSCIKKLVGDNTVRMITTKERGLSNSRNKLISNAEGDICILGDDDIVYLKDYLDKVSSAYDRHPDADIIAFSFTQSLDSDTRRQFKREKRVSLLEISKIASVEITFKKKSIEKKGISFCPLLGLGAKYGACEENAFLADALRAGLKIWYVPETICYLKPDPPEREKWSDGFHKEYFVNRGACFYRIYWQLFLPFSLAFLVLKRKVVLKNTNIFTALNWMRSGKKAIMKEL